MSPLRIALAQINSTVGDLEGNGVDAFLSKPLKIPQLKELVAKLLGRAAGE